MTFLGGSQPSVSRTARALCAAAFIAHMAEIGARGVAGMHPVSSAVDAIGFLAWIMVGAFLLAQWKRPLDAVGAFVAPVALVLLVIANLTPDQPGTVEGLGVLGRVHIALASVGVSVFALATGLATFYLVQEGQLKHKKMGKAVKRGTPLDTLDALLHKSVLIGFPIFTVAMVTGALFMARLGRGIRIEYVVAPFAWSAFAALLIARHTAGWRGRKTAQLTILGFVASLVVLGIYLWRHAAGAL
jgi:ABC-type uncharacterized transport system permease subunit